MAPNPERDLPRSRAEPRVPGAEMEAANEMDTQPSALSPQHSLIDTHAHLDDPKLVGDLPGILGRARDAGVVGVIARATTADSAGAVVAIAREHAGVWAAVGIQPNHVAEEAPG